ncbi:CdaR family protein [Jeotgalibacillus marinus]|uniref:CdaR family protein n=1 Tax=Jeotgalibacillus marinus TaxID=86667 RepID=A0ABV3Q7J4_9BACL
MDKFIDSRWFLRGFALLMASIMFATVNNPGDQLNSSDTGKIENVPVEVIYDKELFVVSEIPPTIDVTIEGPPQIVASAKTLRNFRVFIDLSEEEIGTNEVEIQYEGLSTNLSVTLSTAVVNVKIDERVSEEFPVEIDYNNDIIPEGYEVDQINTNPETVLVTGAKEIVESIRHVRATLNLDGTVEDEETVDSPVRVLNEDLDKLEVSVEPSSVDVSISVVQPSKEVKLVPEPTGTIIQGFELKELSLTQTTVTIFGQPDEIANIDEIEVPFDLSSVEKSGSKISVPIPLPNGVNKLSQEMASAIVIFNEVEEAADDEESVAETGSVENEEDEENTGENASPDTEQEELELSSLPVEVRGTGDDLRVTFIGPPSGELDLRVTGEPDVLEELTESDVALYVDATDLTEGKHELDVQIEGPKNVTYILSQVDITIELTQT